jgi:hypothetical protein
MMIALIGVKIAEAGVDRETRNETSIFEKMEMKTAAASLQPPLHA